MESMIKLKLKNSNLKLLLSVVSFSASEDHFAQMISTVNNRQRLVYYFYFIKFLCICK